MRAWSASPFVAAYFAFAEKKDVERVAVWVYADRRAGSHSGVAEEPAISFLGPKVSAHKRHFLQQSVYTFASKAENDDYTFVSHVDVKRPSDESQDVRIKITIPAAKRITALKSLNKMNMNHANIFQNEEELAMARAQQSTHFHAV